MIMANDMLSQEEIDAILKGGDSNEPTIEFHEDESLLSEIDEDILTEMEVDALGEIGNISMGTAATTLSTLLNRKVNITTPSVVVTNTDELAKEYQLPFVAIDVSYKEGLMGSNILILHTDDVKIITDLMMGKDEFDLDREISDMDLSAVSEAMNQMMGSASTSLSEMLFKKIDIEPPVSMEITFDEGREKFDLLKTKSPIIKVSFNIVIDDVINSNMMQLIPIEFGKDMVENLIGTSTSEVTIGLDEIEKSNNIETTTSTIEYIEQPKNQPQAKDVERTENINYNNISKPEQDVVVKKPEFNNFTPSAQSHSNSPIDLVGDIPVEITVELGRTHKKISDILELGQGSVVELDKLVGESLNVFANGRFIAKGEVVVIDDSFGVRVTEIENTSKSLY